MESNPSVTAQHGERDRSSHPSLVTVLSQDSPNNIAQIIISALSRTLNGLHCASLDAARLKAGLVMTRKQARNKTNLVNRLSEDIGVHLLNPAEHFNHEDEKSMFTFIINRYGAKVLKVLRHGTEGNEKRASRPPRYLLFNNRKLAAAYQHRREIRQAWPQLPKNETILSCVRRYREAIKWKKPDACACCGRRVLGAKIYRFHVPHGAELPMNLDVLEVTDPDIIEYLLRNNSTEFTFQNPALTNHMLWKSGIVEDATGSTVDLCNECKISLQRDNLPKFSLKNGLYRGQLPDHLRDLTWIEEMVCAIYRTTAHVTRMYENSDGTEQNPLRFFGNTCAHDTNIVSTATVLPRVPADVLGNLSVVFVGPGDVIPEEILKPYQIRKQKVWDFLIWLKANNGLYKDLPLSLENLALYHDDDVLPGLRESVIHDRNSHSTRLFQQETSGPEPHPADLSDPSLTDVRNLDPEPFLESMGVSDPESDRLPGRTFTAAALRNLVYNDSPIPDLAIPRGSVPVPEYDNPSFFPGMFPTLFPIGTGGFDDPDREVKLSLQKQTEYYFDTYETAFRKHRFFVFVALNIHQRRTAHLQTYFTVRRSHFEQVAQELLTISPNTLSSLAAHYEKEGKNEDLNDEQKQALQLLNRVNTMAAHIPGSHASKLVARNEIRAYMGFHGLPHLYLTLNPNATHSPIFQLMAGDNEIRLDQQFPQLKIGPERARLLASDPVAAADFFQFCIDTLLTELLGWDMKSERSRPEGGILGHVKAFYGVNEFTNRGQLHGHFVVWLEGGLNPSEVHRRMKTDLDFKQRFFDFFDSIIKHDLPHPEQSIDKDYNPRVEMPPDPDGDDYDREFGAQVKACGEALQRHKHRDVCYKYGSKECRFRYPHPYVEKSEFLEDENAIVFKCLDPTVNYYNPHLLVCCRHNHDIKCILSGKAAKATMFYVTNYITKMDVNTSDLLSLLSRVVARQPADSDQTPQARAKRLLHQCLSQYCRQQQIHAQQAVRYMRGFPDTIQSHRTATMLSSALLVQYRKLAEKSNELPDHDEGEIEQARVRLNVNRDGSANTATQVDDYMFRPESMEDMCYYDFVRFTEKKTKTKVTCLEEPDEDDSEEGTIRLFDPRHPQAKTHRLVQFCDENASIFGKTVIPRVLGSAIPRSSDEDDHARFMLAHFRPFSIRTQFDLETDVVFQHKAYEYAPQHAEIISNWDAIHECEDERDKERLKKRGVTTRELQDMSDALLDGGALEETGIDFRDESAAPELTLRSENSADIREIHDMVNRLTTAGWLSGTTDNNSTNHLLLNPNRSHPSSQPTPINTDAVKTWKTQMRKEASRIRNVRRAVPVDHEDTLSAGLSMVPPVLHTSTPSLATLPEVRPTLTRTDLEEEMGLVF